jgi:transcriptional regulator with XRE-family HTH domain
VGFGIFQSRFKNVGMPNPIHHPKYQVFIDLLAEARASKGLLQSDVADKLGKNQSFVSKYERGERRLDLPEFLEVAEAIGINPNEFIKQYKAKLQKAK